HFTTIQAVDLPAPNSLANVDLLFLTCAPQKKGVSLRDCLRGFVSRGGTLYASDWRYDDLEESFGEMVVPELQGEGLDGTVTADVLDPALQDALAVDRNSRNRALRGQEVDLRFALNRWKTAAFGGPRVTVLARGKYHKMRHDKDKVGVPDEA